MLRDFEYHPHKDLIPGILGRFNIELSGIIALVRFEVITPDSFMWRLLIGDSVYYLYAEDYVPSLSHVKSIFNQYIENDGWSFVKPRAVIQFDDATPVKDATTYNKPDDSDDIMQYAVDSGYDLVFLVRSNENADNAQFSDSAPRGFTLGS
jgi:hypothetical protein